MILVGIVHSGKGDFAFWLERLESYYTSKTGMTFYPGTLNVHLINQSYQFPETCLRLEKEDYGGRVSVNIAPCRVFGRKAFILRTDSDTGRDGTPPEMILEIATDIKLRDAYDLKDGDRVEVEV